MKKSTEGEQIYVSCIQTSLPGRPTLYSLVILDSNLASFWNTVHLSCRKGLGTGLQDSFGSPIVLVFAQVGAGTVGLGSCNRGQRGQSQGSEDGSVKGSYVGKRIKSTLQFMVDQRAGCPNHQYS